MILNKCSYLGVKWKHDKIIGTFEGFSIRLVHLNRIVLSFKYFKWPPFGIIVFYLIEMLGKNSFE